jgi:cytochrome c oxidase assembly protein subunit 15
MSIADRRGWVKLVAWGIFVAVCVQGFLGGTRVTEKSTALAIIHGMFAQIVFAAMASLAAVTCRAFTYTAPSTKGAASTDRMFSTVLVGALVVQLMLGALVRHTNSLVMMHITMAAFVTLVALAAGVRAWGLHGNVRQVKRAGLAVVGLVCLQLCLGVVALVMRPGPGDEPTVAGAFLTTAHQANGAALLALSSVLWVWTWRLLVPGEDAVNVQGVSGRDEVVEVVAS